MSPISTLSRTISHRAGADRDPLHELALRSSYNKSDRLNVPIFREENKQRVMAFKEVLAPGIPLTEAGSFQQSIALPTRALAMALTTDLRLEPLNNTLLHRSYPSARALFPVGADLVFSHMEGETRLAYDESHEALRPRQGSRLGLKRWPSSLRIELTMEMERIAPHYGDLALPLCLFEIGHLAEQICAALRSLGCEFDCRLKSPSSGRAGSPDAQSPLEISLIGQSFLCPSEEDCRGTLRVAEPLLTPADRDLCLQARRWARSSGGITKSIDGVGRQDLFPIPKTPERVLRTAGNTVLGMCGLPATQLEQDGLVASITNTYQALHNTRFPWPSMTILRANPDFSVSAIDLSAVQTRIFENGWTPLSEAYGTFFNVDLQTISLYVMFTAPVAKIVAHSSWGYAEMLVGAGILAQMICNDAASRGFMARPWKGMIEEKLEAAFELEGQCFYTIAMGKADVRNVALSANRIHW